MKDHKQLVGDCIKDKTGFKMSFDVDPKVVDYKINEFSIRASITNMRDFYRINLQSTAIP